MCGIVGHIGPQNSLDIVIEGLRRLEYRGYDSAGVSCKEAGEDLVLVKKEGKLSNLEEALNSYSINALSCVGHTRWATHGMVNESNAHPHQNELFSIVHNGIIENFLALREELKSEGFSFSSETDSEVFLWLLTSEYKKSTQDGSLKKVQESVSRAMARIEGNSALVIQAKATEQIFSIKRGAPLVLGHNVDHQEAMVSSDPYALAGKAQRLFFPEDNVLCVLGTQAPGLIDFYELSGEASTRFQSKEQNIEFVKAEKDGFDHFMLKEIHEQPGLIRMLASYYLSEEGQKALSALPDESPDSFHMIGCGTAWHAGLMIRNFLERELRVPAHCDLASEFRYRSPIVREKDWCLFISQSGETADTLAAQGLCKDKKARTLAIVNVEGSGLYRGCDHNFLIKAGVEVGVASTKAFTLQALTGRVLSLAMKNKNLDGLNVEFSKLASSIDEILSKANEIEQIARAIHNKKGFLFTGRGDYYPVALEGALKLKEIAYVHAEGYAAGELKHGPIALIDDEMVNLALVGPALYDKTVSNLQEVRARRGIIVTLGPIGDKALEEQSDYYIGIPQSVSPDLLPLTYNVALQLLAYYMALFKGTDIDRPRNLAKSVTVE